MLYCKIHKNIQKYGATSPLWKGFKRKQIQKPAVFGEATINSTMNLEIHFRHIVKGAHGLRSHSDFKY